MKYFLRPLAGLFLLLSALPTQAKTVYMGENPGGVVTEWMENFQEFAKSGDHMIINDVCASACTLIIGLVPHDRVCVTPGAWFGFHSAYHIVKDEKGVETHPYSPEATQLVWSTYPKNVQAMLRARGWSGGEHPDLIVINGSRLFKPCDTGSKAMAAGDAWHLPTYTDPNAPTERPVQPVPAPKSNPLKEIKREVKTVCPTAAPVVHKPIVRHVVAPVPAPVEDGAMPLWLKVLYAAVGGLAFYIVGAGAYAIYKGYRTPTTTTTPTA